MSLFISVLLGLFVLSMFFISIEKKIIVLIIGRFCLTAIPCPIPLLGISTAAFPVIFLLSELKNVHLHIKTLKNTPILNMLLISYLSLIILGIHSPHLHSGFDKTFFTFIRDSFLAGNIVLAYSYISFSSDSYLYNIFKVTTFSLFVLTFFGFIQMVTDRNLFIEAIMSGHVMGNEMAINKAVDFSVNRLRIGSMFVNAFDYGYVCVIICLFHIYCLIRGLCSIKFCGFTLFCCMAGVVWCGSRTVILTVVVGIIVFLMLGFKNSIGVKIIMGLLIVVSCLIGFVPFFTEIYDRAISVFSEQSTIGGSSISMRRGQMLAVLSHINGVEWLGNGYQYFNIDMGWGEGVAYLVDTDLAGLEGVHLHILLEQGIIGLILYYLFWIILIFYLYKHYNIDRLTCGFVFSLVACELFFAHATGTMMSMAPTLIFIGIGLKILQKKIDNDSAFN